MTNLLRKLDRILPRVQKPARYTGGEFNSIVKDWDPTSLRIALSYPDLYEVGMSNLGLGIIYHFINERPEWVAERVYCPWPDMEKLMRENDIPLYSLETKRPLAEFDVLAFSLAYEQTYTNVLAMLDLAGLPLRSADRDESMPLVVAGGPSAVNPEPMASFIDIFVVGEAEDAFPDLLERYQAWRAGGGTNREEFLRIAMAVQGVYVPRFYDIAYNDDGTILAIRPNDPAAPHKIRRAIVRDLPQMPTRPIVPFIETVHDRVAVEVMRGCTRGCRFCQPGMAVRPVRERGADEIVATAEALLASTGYDEISLVSLSTSDHSTIDEVATKLRDRFKGEPITISLSSLRVDSFSVNLAAAVAKGGKKGSLTFAPEAGTQRLRDVINKTISDEDLLRSVEHAFSRGWTTIKLYFMIGLPTETDDDVRGIVQLIHQVRNIGKKYAGTRTTVRVTASTFVPKPHTPFQWAAQETAEVLLPRIRILQQGLRAPGIKLSWSDPEDSQLEAAASRGDRRLGEAVYHAFLRGSRFDAWNDNFNKDLWQAAAADAGVDLDFYARRRRPLNEILPWSHIDSGTNEAFLRWDYRKAIREEATPDCHFDVCSGCGLHQTFEPCTKLFNAAVDERKVIRQAADIAGRGKGMLLTVLQ